MATIKLQNLLEKMVENSRKSPKEQLSLRQVILNAGYSESAAANPAEIFNSASWQELVSLIPKNDLLQKLVKNALQDRSIHGSNAALEILLKVMPGGFSPQKISFTTPEDGMSDEELKAEEERLEEEIKKRKK